MSAEIHRSKVGTYHPAPPRDPSGAYWRIIPEVTPLDSDYAAWTIHDSRGTIDGGQACDECGACECPDGHGCKQDTAISDSDECIGLSFAYICLDGGDVLCEECAKKAGIEIVDCDCA